MSRIAVQLILAYIECCSRNNSVQVSCFHHRSRNLSIILPSWFLRATWRSNAHHKS